MKIFRDSRVFIVSMFASGGRHILSSPTRAGVSASVYNLHNLHRTSHTEIGKLRTVGLQ